MSCISSCDFISSRVVPTILQMFYSTSIPVEQFGREFPFGFRDSSGGECCFRFFLSCKQIHWFGYDSMPSPSCKAFVEIRIMFQNLWFYNPSSSGQFLPRPLGINFPATTWWKPGQRPGYPAEFAKIAVVLICSTAAVLAWKCSYPL